MANRGPNKRTQEWLDLQASGKTAKEIAALYDVEYFTVWKALRYWTDAAYKAAYLDKHKTEDKRR